MTRYRIFYLKDNLARSYREAGPRPKPHRLKLRDYEEGAEIAASSPYAAWKQTQSEETETGGGRKLDIGDALEDDSSRLMVLNFWGFDEAQWEASPNLEVPGGLTGMISDPTRGEATGGKDSAPNGSA